jgi:hypothetical protein
MGRLNTLFYYLIKVHIVQKILLQIVAYLSLVTIVYECKNFVVKDKMKKRESAPKSP